MYGQISEKWKIKRSKSYDYELLNVYEPPSPTPRHVQILVAIPFDRNEMYEPFRGCTHSWLPKHQLMCLIAHNKYQVPQGANYTTVDCLTKLVIIPQVVATALDVPCIQVNILTDNKYITG